ncbi:MAG: phosphatase PAP2 family protein [Salinivirgaceae bacterium]|nr:phosphatase PAP2 family protein [Salinivirgaceae bacterium]
MSTKPTPEVPPNATAKHHLLLLLPVVLFQLLVNQSVAITVDTLPVEPSADTIVAQPLVDTVVATAPTADYEFRKKRIILPAALITVGAIGVKNDWVCDVKLDVRDGLEDWLGSERELRIDDQIQYLPAAAFIGLDYLGVKATHPLRERIAVVVTSYAAMGTMVRGIKWVINEERPDSSKKNSFPSGHTATSFTGAELIRIEYGPAAGGCAYALATGIAFMRLYNDRHWLNDVIGGAGFGILSARVGYWLLPIERRLFKWDQSSVTTAVVPVYNPADNSFGMAMTVVF